MLPPGDATKLIRLCTQASPGITAHSVPPPSPPGWGDRDRAPEELGKGQLIWVCSPSHLLQRCQYLHLLKGQRHCLSFHEWQKRGTRLLSREAAGNGADVVEEDDQDHGEAFSENCIGLSSS